MGKPISEGESRKDDLIPVTGVRSNPVNLENPVYPVYFGFDDTQAG
jgi:hypothetical protein